MAGMTYITDEKNGMIQTRNIYSRMLEDRIIFIDEPITEDLASIVVAQLLHLESVDEDADIRIYINSPGGSVNAGLAIIDTMEIVKTDIATFCIGTAASMAAVILSAGAKGKRFATKRSEVLIHQPIGGAIGQAADVKIHAEHILNKRRILNEMLAENTGQDIKKIEADTDRDNYMSAEEAVKYGLIDGILEPR